MRRQAAIIDELVEALKSVQKISSRPERLEAFKTRLEEFQGGDFGTFYEIRPTMFMLDPKRKMVAIDVEKVSRKLFNIRFEYKTSNQNFHPDPKTSS